MNFSLLLRLVVLFTSLVIIGEAFALLVGMHVLSKQGYPWVSFKNDLLLVADISTGVGLIYFAMVNGATSQLNFLYFIIALALLAHGYREWEYLMNSHNKFCINFPLFVLNNVKLVGLLGTTVIIAVLRTTWV